MSSMLLDTPDLLAINKPEGLASIPERDLAVPSLVRTLEAERGEKLFVVHRLDKEASGVILFAKNAETHRYLNGLFSGHEVSKTYLVLTHGLVPADEGRINRPLREFGSGRMGIDEARGKSAVTEFKVRDRYRRFTLIEAHPVTGRRHQLRVHFYSIGHPIVGDLRYGDRASQSAFPRLMLHALRLEFPLPSGERITVEAPIPDSFRAVLDVARTLKE